MPDQPQTDAPEELSIEEQLDALLVQLEQAEPGLLNRPEPPKPREATPPTAADDSATAVEEAAAVVEEAPAEAGVTAEATEAVAQDPPPADPADQVIEQQIDQRIEDQVESVTESADAEPAAAAEQTAPVAQDASAAESDGMANKLDQLLSEQIEDQIDDLEAGISFQDEDAIAASNLDVANEIDSLVDQELAATAQADQADEADPPVQEIVEAEPPPPPVAEATEPAQEAEVLQAAEILEAAATEEAQEGEDDDFDEIVAMVAPPEPEAAPGADPEEPSADITDQLQALLEQAEQDEKAAQAAAAKEKEALGAAAPSAEAEPAAAPIEEPVAGQPQASAVEDQDISLDDIDDLLAGEAEGVDEEFGELAEAPRAAMASAPDDASAQDIGSSRQRHDPFQDAAEPQPAGEPLDLSASGFNADAQAVAKELDEQPERRPSLQSAGQMADAMKQAATPDKKGLKIKIAVCEKHLRKTCYVMNWPLRKAPSSVKEIVGYAALLQLFIGSVLILGKMTGLI